MVSFRCGIRMSGLLLLAAVATGCVSPRAYHCGDGCGPRIPSARMADCGGCEVDDCSQDCGIAACGPACGPLGTGFWSSILGCRAGCGRMYWGEWAYDPPDDCDPCNDYGDWVGPRCCPPGGWWSLWRGVCGLRCAGACGSAACDDCGSTCDTAQPEDCCDGDLPLSADDEYIDETWVEARRPSRTSMGTRVMPASPARGVLQATPTPAAPRDPQSRVVRRHRSPPAR